ncbi:CerR family C-terminal domain-containing protein [Methylomicrobium sp. Wu6]|uniref:CerR family C-terminal domain-containing protein n=1 Tax=Methylomicrobium sp. Wu6 TaxID=3107928 RepID=UPI002DD642C6|nr:CerR family C-terminal domain-containing protein [Methylomicrobium sp. Wu6]MEC4747273.1 CerR family C-terminal domain-containing protein [Methylomicrobium sp. Wu6]
MTDLKKKSERTRNRLLTAACRIFAEKGFQEATIAEICEQAQTNIASVNYHFRDKETLYLESWRFAFTHELTRHPPDGGVAGDAAPEQRLAGRIYSLIQRVADRDGYSFAIMHKEMARPTRLLADILEKEIDPQRRQLFGLLRECLGQAADDRHLQYCHDSIMGQCFQLLRLKQIQHVRLQPDPPADLSDIKAYADHVVQFSLAGIEAIRTHTHN